MKRSDVLVQCRQLTSITLRGTKRLQREEHKRFVERVNTHTLRYSLIHHRPPHGSLAAVAQSAADRNSTGNRVNGGPASRDVNIVTQEDASRLMSEEHRWYMSKNVWRAVKLNNS